MKRLKIIGTVLALLALAGTSAAQSNATIRGQVWDVEGKIFPGVKVVIKHEETGSTYEVITDREGKFTHAGLRAGTYSLIFRLKDPKTNEERDVYTHRLRLATSATEEVKINFKELVAQDAAAQAAIEMEKKAFEGMKAAFDAGVAALDQGRKVDAEMRSLPSDQRGSMQPQLEQLRTTAIDSFQQALQIADADDSNRHLLNAKLGESYEFAGKYAEAAEAYQKATELKPDQPGYFNNLGNALAKLGKIPEAMAAYEQAATIDPANAAGYWLNAGVVLYNSSKYKEAVEVLRKSTSLSGKNAQAWYVLGASLVGLMDFKMEGDKQVPIIQPGTIEAYQKCIEVNPSGPFAAQAEQALKELEAIGVGIPTKIRSRKK